MTDGFKIWSKSNPEALENINPKIGLREWDDLSEDEKDKIFRYFINNKWFVQDIENLVFNSTMALNRKYKKESYGIKTLKHNGPHITYNSLDTCCKNIAFEDFSNIILTQKQDIVYELITIYAWHLIDHRQLKSIDEKDDEGTRKDKIERAYNKYRDSFDDFMKCFNDIFEQFAINIILTRNSIVPRQDEKITKDIYEPVLTLLADPKWEPVNRDLRDAFSDYRTKTEQGYSSCVTHTISSLQAFLQILVYGNTGKGDIGDLISQARNKLLIPDDKFTEQIFKNMESILMFERQVTADAHPKKEYATEKNARLIMNLVMIFFQHCLQ
jgi:hypothetical protein